jgi:hypothetical protein
LLDLVRSNLEAFSGIGFVFVRDPNKDEDVERARGAATASYPGNPRDIPNWPASEMFTGWRDSDLNRWPTSFFEFWMPRGNLSVYARVVVHIERQTGTVFSERSWPAIRRNLEIAIPTAGQIGTADAELTKKLLMDHRAKLFPTAVELWKVLAELDPM